jgi:hypothetical protein
MVGASFHGVVARSHRSVAHSVGGIGRTPAIRPPSSLIRPQFYGLCPSAPTTLMAMTSCVLIVSAVIGLMLVVLEQGKWTSQESWFLAIFASAVMAMVIDHYVNQMRLLVLG